ncbi:MAG TPA: hypothetical protein VHJ69_00505 [Gemmatimonadales bacterium]|nr:hypothetical protein [Gemmatimonadales bacterium]
MGRSRLMLTAFVALQAAGAGTTAAAQRLVDVRELPVDTLRDLAVVTYELGRPIIYYNPILMQRVGPQMADFFMAHEYGHIANGHAGAALTLGGTDVGTIRQRQELEADCYATAALAERNGFAVSAALEFFTRLGPFRFDNLHPTGAQRAAKILACIPEGVELPHADAPADAALPIGWTATAPRTPAASPRQ